MDFRFPKEQKIYLKHDIDALFESRKTVYKSPVKAIYIEGNGKGYPRALFSVPKKLFKRAVHRNLLKRRMREAFRLSIGQYPELQCTDFGFLYISNEITDYGTILAKIQKILEQVAQTGQENI